VALERVTLKTSDGLALEGELAVPDEPWCAAVLAHPHPQYGGSMRSIVIGALFAALPDNGIAALRFNFRGVEGSEGEFDDGRGERHDIVAALDVLHPITEGLPLVLAGWSFGADTSLDVVDDRLTAWFAVAPPLRHDADYEAATDPRPKFVAVPEHDQFRSPSSANPILSSWTNTTVEVVKGADHFLVGRTDKAVELFLSFAKPLSSQENPS
jgi:alpha/beta superfamily hydrolase